MFFTKEEIGLMVYSLRSQPGKDGDMPRQLMVDDQKKAVDLFERLKESSTQDGDRLMFVDGEIDMSTTEKTFMLSLLKRVWPVETAVIKVKLEVKLEA